MSKKNNTPLGIFMEAIGLYFSNFTKFVRYMTFPVLGQIAGLLLVFLITYLYTKNLPPLIDKFSSLNNFNLLVLLSILITLPGLAIFVKAFWDYLVAYGAVNSMYENMQKSGRVYDFGAHTELIKRRTGSYILFLLLISIIYLLLSFPLLWGLLAIVFVYLALSFQVFALEEDKSAFGAIKTSISLIKFNFWRTTILLIMLGVTTYWLIPGLISWGFEQGDLAGFFSYPVEQYIRLLPLNDFNSILANSPVHYTIKSYTIAKFIVLTTVSFAVTGFTLPLRSLCCTELYKEIIKKNYAGKIAADKLAQRAQKPKNNKKRKNIEDDED